MASHMTKDSTQRGTLSEINREYWDARANEVFKQDWVKKLSEQITETFRSQVDAIAIRKPSKDEPPVKMLDYACGNGMASRAFAPYVEILRGIDISDAMVENYNKMARDAGLPEEKMHAVQGDLLSDENAGPAPDFSDFDLAVISMALHHVSDPQGLVSKLVDRLKHDGVLVVVDWMPGATHPHVHKHHKVNETIAKESFDVADITEIFTKAGCKTSTIAYVEGKEPTNLPEHVSGVEGGLEKRVFLAWGRKA